MRFTDTQVAVDSISKTPVESDGGIKGYAHPADIVRAFPLYITTQYREINADYTIIENDYTINCTANCEITLPAATQGKVYVVKNTANSVIVRAAGAELIDGDSAITLPKWAGVTLQGTLYGTWILI